MPIKKSGSKVEGVIHTISGGRVDFWTLNNPNAGRSRKYHGVIIDEAAFAGADMGEIWSKSIKPALLDYRGVAWALSTPNGKDDENWFYNICTGASQSEKWVEFHAPTSSNPHLPAEEIAQLKADNLLEVYLQEYEAEFVDWTGVAFFPEAMLLVDGAPVPMPTKCDIVFAVIDTAIKAGQEHNATGVTWFSYNRLLQAAPVNILGWDIIQIEGALQQTWLDGVFVQGEEYAERCGARRGFAGAFIEDKATGSVLIQQAKNDKRPVHAIDSKLTAMGKEERAIAASPYIVKGDVKITDEAFSKTSVLKGKSANHFLKQVLGFRLGSKDKDGKDLLDTFCYGVCISRGAGGGEGKGI